MDSMKNELQQDEEMQAAAQMWKHIYGFAESLTLRCAIQLGLPDILHRHGQPMTLSEIASEFAIPCPNMDFFHRLMRFMVHMKLFAVVDGPEKKYSLTPVSKLLVRSEEKNLVSFAWIQLQAEPMLMWEHLIAGIEGETPPWLVVHKGVPIYERIGKDPEFNKLFNDAMTSHSSLVVPALVQGCAKEGVLEGVHTLVDVGGSSGVVSKAITNSFPHVKCTVMDLAHVLESVPKDPMVDFVAGDAFDYVPKADAVLMKVLIVLNQSLLLLFYLWRLYTMAGQARRENYHWDPKEERVLMDMLLLMKQRGRKSEKNFTKACWDEVLAKIKEETGREPDIVNAKNKLKNWRARYKEVKQLLNMSGFGWDDTRKMVTAPNDVWNALVQAKSKLSKYKTLQVSFFDEINELVADDVAEGNIAMTGGERSTIDVEAMMTDEEFINATYGTPYTGLNDIDDDSLPETNVPTPEPSRPTATHNSNKNTGKKQRSRVGEEINKTLANVAVAVNNLAERINTPEPVYILMNKVTNGVISCPFIPPQAYVAVTEYLAQDERKANLFLTYSDEMKQQWFEMHFTNLGSSSGGR